MLISHSNTLFLHSPQRLSRCEYLDYFPPCFVVLYSFASVFFFFFVSLLRSIIWIFHVMSFCAITWIFYVMSFCAIIWIFHVMSFCAIIWIFRVIFLWIVSAITCDLYSCDELQLPKQFNFRYGLDSILQVKRNILSCMKPRTKGSLFKRGLCWIESVVTPLAAAAPSATPPSRLCLCFTCNAVTPTWQGTVWDPGQKLSCNEFPALQSVFSDFSTGLQPTFAFRYAAQHEPGPKKSMKTSISQTLRYRSTKLRYPYMNFSFDIEVIFDIGLLRYRSLLQYRSIFNIEVLRYRSPFTSISQFCEIRYFDIEVNGLLYRSPKSGPISKSI